MCSQVQNKHHQVHILGHHLLEEKPRMTCRVLVQSSIGSQLPKTVIHKQQNVLLSLVGLGSPKSRHRWFTISEIQFSAVWLAPCGCVHSFSLSHKRTNLIHEAPPSHAQHFLKVHSQFLPTTKCKDPVYEFQRDHSTR